MWYQTFKLVWTFKQSKEILTSSQILCTGKFGKHCTLLFAQFTIYFFIWWKVVSVRDINHNINDYFCNNSSFSFLSTCTIDHNRSIKYVNVKISLIYPHLAFFSKKNSSTFQNMKIKSNQQPRLSLKWDFTLKKPWGT